eukprot:CAMPEP_0204415414 /NCGR_PEP_ID=MMETSP0470-20130426/23667_1 /ASSEMBLY_ACC=CAM_ASM_000385 /TAXON_ID=2969 /ORGANISM="Oxyrrhis marina" /LENGTH=71 /DNA_ID=CAMNT_0051411775 /DNA_START=78 /DNA_END=293 /DNA_ORIENTATION=-
MQKTTTETARILATTAASSLGMPRTVASSCWSSVELAGALLKNATCFCSRATASVEASAASAASSCFCASK